MRAKKNILISIILGILIGWILGFLRFPSMDKNHPFLLGFIACMALVSLGLTVIFVWNKHSHLAKLLGKNQATKDSGNAIKTNTLIWVLVSLFIVLGGSVSSFLIFKQNEKFKTQTNYLNKKIGEQTELIESVRKGSLVHLMSNILDKVDDELKNNPTRTLSDETIERIAALSYSFQPYNFIEGDSLSAKKYSPERGQLLLALSKTNMDSSSFDQIKLKTTFSWADLRGADLMGEDLGKADLRNANLNDADLREAELKGANLKSAVLWGANLRKANMMETDLELSDLRWSDLNGANLKGANLNGVDLTHANLRKADLRGTEMQWADLSGAFVNESNLSGANMFGTTLRKANLSGTDFSGANMSAVNFSGANLKEANLSGVKLIIARVEEENWLEKLTEWQVIGAVEIQKRYTTSNDKSGRANYRLDTLK